VVHVVDPKRASELRAHATSFAATADPEFASNTSPEILEYANMLWRGLLTMGGTHSPAITTLMTFHADACRRYAAGRDLPKVTQHYLSSDFGAVISKETSRVLMEKHSSSASGKRPYAGAQGGRGRPPPAGQPPNGTDVCRDFARGTCTRGTFCRFAHTPGAAPPGPPRG